MVAFQALRNTLHYGLGCSVGAVNAHVYDLMKTACLLVITWQICAGNVKKTWLKVIVSKLLGSVSSDCVCSQPSNMLRSHVCVSLCLSWAFSCFICWHDSGRRYEKVML